MAIVSPGLNNPAAAVVLILLLEAEILIEGKILLKKIACVDKFNKNMFLKKNPNSAPWMLVPALFNQLTKHDVTLPRN